jgi:hypothetical protein
MAVGEQNCGSDLINVARGHREAMLSSKRSRIVPKRYTIHTRKLERHHRIKPLFENAPVVHSTQIPVTLDERAPALQGPQTAQDNADALLVLTRGHRHGARARGAHMGGSSSRS